VEEKEGQMMSMVFKRGQGVSLLLGLLASVVVPGLIAGSVWANDYPNRSITLVVPWAAGGGTDTVARILAPEVEKVLGQKVVVVNKTGGNGAVGHTYGAQARPDGYTITLGTTEMSTVHLLGLAKFSYRDFDPICLVATGPGCLAVLDSSPYRTLADLVADAKKNPGQIKISSIGVGGIWNLVAVGLCKRAGIRMNILPYEGGGPAVVAALGGHVDGASVGFMEALPQVLDKKMRFLGVASAERLKTYPEYPTFKEQGIDLAMGAYWAVMVPKNVPADIKAKISQAFGQAVSSQKFTDLCKQKGFIQDYKDTEEFTAWLQEMDKAFKDVVAKQ
jgi:tripartite-type tricarboxylate transporter receptor subunit TctC